MNEILTLTRKDTATYQVSVSKGAQRQTLMADDFIDITIESSEPIDFGMGDKATIFGATYSINQLPQVDKQGDDLYVYTARLEGVLYDLLKARYLLFDTTGVAVEGDFDLMANLRDVLSLMVQNLNRVYGAGSYVLGTVPATPAANHTFSSENCLQVLQRICTHYDVEFGLKWQQGALIIDIGHVGSTKEISLQYGQGKGLYKLSRRSVNDKNVFTRVFAYGSDKNLPLHYRSFSRRLKLPNVEQSYIEDAAAIDALGLIENIKVFDDIYPRRTGIVSSVADKLTFADQGMDFDLNETSQGNTLYLIPGNSAKVSFTTGNLAGYDFEITSYNHGTRTFRIIPFTDDRGMEFPGDSPAFKIAPGDQYVLLDIRMPATYVAAAEYELLARATEYLNDGKTAKAQYSCEIDPIYARQEALEIRPGDSIPVEDTGLGINRHFRVLNINRDLLEPYKWNIELGDEVAVSIITRLYQHAVEINKIVQRNSLHDPAVYRHSWRNTRELESMIFDQDNYFDTDKIRPLSISTAMLSVGGVAGQFVLNGIVFQPNFNGVSNRFQSTTGTLSHYAIGDNIRTWNIAFRDQTLPDNNARYIYVRCQIQGTDAEIRLETTQIKVDGVQGFYTFLVGVLHTVQDGFRRISLTYGTTVVHGREIRTGRIQSVDGSTYFDLDNSEIGGRIVFRSGKNDQQIETDISTAQTNATTAQSTATTAQSAANNAMDFANHANNSATTANMLLSEISSDARFTPVEKQAVRKEFDVIAAERTRITDEATKFGVSSTAYTTAFNTLSTYITPLLADLATTSVIVGITFRANFLAYYNARQDLLNAITTAAKALADAAQSTANTAQSTANIKRRVFVATPTTPYEIGDLWVEGATGDIRRCNVTRLTGAYTAADWGLASRYTDDTVAIAAQTSAAAAQSTANVKRRVFVATPTTPYEIGDLWVDGTNIRRCATAKLTGQAFHVNDWVIPVNYDNTQTVINGGIVTSGTIQVAGDMLAILAGITGQGAVATSVRFWAGASFENRATAPFRVLQNGSVVLSAANVSGTVTATSGAIGGFEIAQGRIGVLQENQGLTIIGQLIKFSDATTWSGIGTNVFPTLAGVVCLARHELNRENMTAGEGIALFTKARFPNDGWDQALLRRSHWNDGNIFSTGGHCWFDDRYIGQAFTDTLERNIDLTHTYIFTSIASSLLTVRLPSQAMINTATEGRNVSFLLQILIGVTGNANAIRVTGVATGVLRNEFANPPNGGNGWLDMDAGDSLLLRYINGNYHVINYNR